MSVKNSGFRGGRFWRAAFTAFLIGLAGPSITTASAQTIIDNANACLARNQQASHLGAAFGAVACFNRNMAAIAERRDEIDKMVRIVDRCRGRIERRPEAESCRIATVAGVINQPPIWVERGAKCSSQWNEFAYSLTRLLADGCSLTKTGQARFDGNGKLVIRMSGPNDDFLEDVWAFLEEELKSENAFELFDRCFNSCARSTDTALYQRYGIKGYKDMSQRYRQLHDRYQEEGLQKTFAALATTCDRVSGRWWGKASARDQERLECRAPPARR